MNIEFNNLLEQYLNKEQINILLTQTKNFLNENDEEYLKYKLELILNSIENNYITVDENLNPIENIYDLNPTKWKIYKDDEKLEEKILNIEKQTTDIFTCSRCHKNKCIYTTVQTRSADEGETIFIECINCNKKWKQ